ncbi:Hypothetical predicted protein [Pelobates cultripes]|uniref:Uncharacterized protein n=1 Tax=Pelobates cultripes TaxID=61616 RepID=A0AAD1W0D4_PELCU|nr:Hypothetical predicted protein [Pelobates cultripes]
MIWLMLRFNINWIVVLWEKEHEDDEWKDVKQQETSETMPTREKKPIPYQHWILVSWHIFCFFLCIIQKPWKLHMLKIGLAKWEEIMETNLGNSSSFCLELSSIIIHQSVNRHCILRE